MCRLGNALLLGLAVLTVLFSPLRLALPAPWAVQEAAPPKLF